MYIIRALFTLALVTSLTLQGATENIGFVFAHGFGGTLDQIHWYKDGNSLNWSIIGTPCASFNFPEVDEKGDVNKQKANFAQEEDVTALKLAHEKLCNDQALKVNSVVLVGMSRGASTIINYAATKPKKVKALVLEAPFDTVENVIYYQLRKRYIGYIPGVTSLVCNVLGSGWPAYKPDGIKPLHSITKIDKKMPMLFIHSKQDGLIDFENCKALYTKLKKRGYKHVHFLELDSGTHAFYQKGSDAQKYQATVHAFYKKYGIPYNKELADKGKEFLN